MSEERSVKAGLLLSELRRKGVVEESPEKYSPRSWVRAAHHCVTEAQAFELQGKTEDAFVAYLRALGCFEAFTKHHEYPEIKAQGVKHDAWRDAMGFQADRQVYIDKAKSLTEILKERDVEKGSNGQATPDAKPSTMPHKPPKPLPVQPSHKPQILQQPLVPHRQQDPTRPPTQHRGTPPQTPLTSSSAQSFATAMSASTSESDTLGGGSIAARMAALRGAGMQTGGKDGADTGTSSNGNGNVSGPVSAGLQSAGTGSSGSFGNTGRRGSSASISQGFAGLKLDTNGTGSSVSSIGKVGNTGGDYKPDGPYGPSYAAYRERHGSGPPTPILTPNASGTVSQAETTLPMATGRQEDSLAAGRSPNPSSRPLPSVPNHLHKSSLPNLPTPSTASFSLNPPANRSRHGTLSTSQNVPPPIQEDELAHFSSTFPDLPEFESSPTFASSSSSPALVPSMDLPHGGANGRGDRAGSRMPRSPLAEHEGFTFPTLPSPPKHRPGQQTQQAGSSVGAASGAAGPAGSPSLGSGSSLPAIENGTPPASNRPLGASSSSQDISGGLGGRFQLNPKLYDRSIGAPVNAKASSRTDAKPTPVLPFGNSITASRLHDYLANTLLDILIIDTRTHEEYSKDWVGRNIDMGDGRKPQTIWVDSTVLGRSGLTSAKLEDSLALSPPADQKAFADRAQADLVVIYDDASTAFPSSGVSPSPPAALFSVIYEKEFSKVLKRAPVLLVGGYRAWKAEMDRNSFKAPRPPVPFKKPALPPTPDPDGSAETRANRRETQVYRAAPMVTTPYSRNITENFGAPQPQSMAGPSSTYGGRPLTSSAAAGPSSYASRYNSTVNGGPTPPPAASISPGRVTRKSSDYAEHHTQPYAGYSAHAPRASLDYASGHPGAPQPPPPAVAPGTARQENRPQPPRRSSTVTFDNLTRLPAGQDMLYWSEVSLGISGLKNLGNTCYMNSTLQCLSATYPLARFFRDGSFRKAINTTNPMGTKGDLARAFATLVTMLWEESFTFLSPVTFRKSISQFAPQFAGTDQHDSQEFLSFLLDGLHEDLSRVHKRPAPVEMTPEREAALETLPPAIAADKEWRIYKQRNDSLIVDLFQGQYRNRMECMTCHQTSTTYDSFMYLSLPVPRGRDAVVLQQLIDEFVKTETLSGEDAWNCPRCKVARKATKSLSIARLPPVLLVHLKRFSTKDGHFWDKSETPVIFPVKNLDMTHYLPPSRGPNIGPGDDPMSQNGPFKFDLFAVSNHMGSLSNGHYTAFVNSSTGWQYCDDSKITLSSERDVITKPAYILFYKRVIN